MSSFPHSTTAKKAWAFLEEILGADALFGDHDAYCNERDGSTTTIQQRKNLEEMIFIFEKYPSITARPILFGGQDDSESDEDYKCRRWDDMDEECSYYPLMAVLRYGNNHHPEKLIFRLVKLVYDSYPDAIRFSDQLGYTALHYACLRRLNTVIQFLIQEYPEALRIESPFVGSPLDIVCSFSKDSPTMKSCVNEDGSVGPVVSTKTLEMMIRGYPEALQRDGDVMDCSYFADDFHPSSSSFPSPIVNAIANQCMPPEQIRLLQHHRLKTDLVLRIPKNNRGSLHILTQGVGRALVCNDRIESLDCTGALFHPQGYTGLFRGVPSSRVKDLSVLLIEKEEFWMNQTNTQDARQMMEALQYMLSEGDQTGSVLKRLYLRVIISDDDVTATPRPEEEEVVPIVIPSSKTKCSAFRRLASFLKSKRRKPDDKRRATFLRRYSTTSTEATDEMCDLSSREFLASQEFRSPNCFLGPCRLASWLGRALANGLSVNKTLRELSLDCLFPVSLEEDDVIRLLEHNTSIECYTFRCVRASGMTFVEGFTRNREKRRRSIHTLCLDDCDLSARDIAMILETLCSPTNDGLQEFCWGERGDLARLDPWVLASIVPELRSLRALKFSGLDVFRLSSPTAPPRSNPLLDLVVAPLVCRGEDVNSPADDQGNSSNRLRCLDFHGMNVCTHHDEVARLVDALKRSRLETLDIGSCNRDVYTSFRRGMLVDAFREGNCHLRDLRVTFFKEHHNNNRGNVKDEAAFQEMMSEVHYYCGLNRAGRSKARSPSTTPREFVSLLQDVIGATTTKEPTIHKVDDSAFSSDDEPSFNLPVHPNNGNHLTALEQVSLSYGLLREMPHKWSNV